MKVLLVISILMSFEWASAGCQSEAMEREDRRMFDTRLNEIKERVGGYSSFVEQKRKLEVQRLKGIEAQKKLREKEEVERSKRAQAYHTERLKDLKERRTAMAKAWQGHARKVKEHREMLSCSRDAYIRARKQFEAARERVLERTEEQELEMISR